MARQGACDARCQAFRKETIVTEDSLRMKWFMKNRERLLENLEQEDQHVREKLKRFKAETELETTPEKTVDVP